jgi:hypothetical protein
VGECRSWPRDRERGTMTLVSSRRIAGLGGFAAALATSLYAVDADAAPRGRRGDGIHQGGYIYGAPGVVQLPI